MKQLFNLVVKSGNVKTGAMPNSMSHAGTCPDACPLKQKGCYAKCGPIGYIFSCLSTGYMERKGKRYPFGMTYAQFMAAIKALPAGQAWRHNTAGDLQGDGKEINGYALGQLVGANKGKRGYTYTHYDPKFGRNTTLIGLANESGFTINLSANSLKHADELKAANCGPVCVLLPSDFKGVSGETPAGNRFIVCPAQTKGLTCDKCLLCQKQRGVIVGFLNHGAGKNAADKVARD